MAEKLVVALFASRGIAEDARNRLLYEEVPARRIRLVTLREWAPLPQHLAPEIAGHALDPLVIDDIRETFAPHIRNGETAVLVWAPSEAEVDFAIATLKQYFPVKIAVVSPEELPAAHHRELASHANRA